MHAVVVAGGELPGAGADAVTRLIDQADVVIAADSGFDHCRTLGRWPTMLVGDLDSISADGVTDAEAHDVQIKRFPADKDATDLALAFEEAIDRGASAITVVGAFGGRLDHELATIGMLTTIGWAGIAISADDGCRRLWVVHSTIELAQPIGSTLSIVPWGNQSSAVTTSGLQWPLHNDTLAAGSTRGVSNICVAPTQSITADNGVVLVIAVSEQR